MKTLNLNLFDLGSLDRAVLEVERMADTLPGKCRRFCERLAEIGVNVVRVTYTAALYAGANDAEVHLEWTDEGCAIVASGASVGFIEFGTGVKYPLGEYADQAGAPPHGTYGKGNGSRGSWGYYVEPGNLGRVVMNRAGNQVVITDGNPPANAFPQAVQAMREQIDELAREVFQG